MKAAPSALRATRLSLPALARLAAALLTAAAAQAQNTLPVPVPVLSSAPAPSAATAAPMEAAWTARVQQLAMQAAQAAFGANPQIRVEVVAGALDPRLKLAPCNRVDVYLPQGQRAWGRTRVGLRCVEGSTAWNVYLPLTVKVFAPALVATQALAAGTVLQAEHLRAGEADWAASESPVVGTPEAAWGRTLAQGLAAGEALRDGVLKKRVWFAIGDPVKVVAVGQGFAVSAEGVALSPGLEGQVVKVRTEGGRTVTGLAAGQRRVEVAL